MSLLDWLRRLVGADASATAAAAGEPAVATLPAPAAPEISLDEEAEPGWWAPRGEPVLARPAPSTSSSAADARIHAAIQQVLAAGDLDLPMLPSIAQRGLVLLQDTDVNYRELADLIGEDAAISAEVLRVVNSAAYARLFRVNQLEAAFTRLGRDTLRALLIAMTLKGMAIRIGGPVRTLGEELWQRALVSGVLLSEMSRRYGLAEGDAFLAGLLHDIGDLAILRVLHDCQKTLGASVSRAVFDRLSDEWHEPLGLRLAEAWRLPDPLPAVIGDHHRDPPDSAPHAGPRLLVQFADVTCGLLGYGKYVPYDFFRMRCVQRLGLHDTPETRRWLIGLPALIAERAGVF